MENSGWNKLAEKNSIAGFVDINLRGASQVFFQNNSLTGLIILVAIFWGAQAAGNLSVAFGAVVGLVSATSMAILLHVDRSALRQGLFGFNGILVGTALPTFLSIGPLLWAYIVIGAAVSTVVTLAVANVVKIWGVPGSTAPFVFTTWLLLLGAYSLAALKVGAMRAPSLLNEVGVSGVELSAGSIMSILARNVSQVYLIENVTTGALFLVAIAVSSLRGALFAIIGSVVSLATAIAFGAKGASIQAGLYGFSAVLTAMAVGAVFNQPSVQVTLYAILATVFTVIVQAALTSAMSPLGIPTLTFPYVLVMWFFLLPKANLSPDPHHRPIPGGLLAKK